MSILAKLFGISVPTWAVEIVAVLALVGGALGWFAHHERGVEIAKLQKSSAALVAKANKTVAAETAQHTASDHANQEKLNAAIAASNVLGSALAQRVRDFDAYRKSHPGLPRPAGNSVAAPDRESSAVDFGAIALELAERGNELADSVGQLRASLQACQRDRDSLTGLPR